MPPWWKSSADSDFMQSHLTGLLEQVQASKRIPAEKVSMYVHKLLLSSRRSPWAHNLDRACVWLSGRNVSHFLSSLIQGSRGPLGALQREGSRFHNTELTPFLSPLHLHLCLSQWLTWPTQKELGPFWAKPLRKCSSGGDEAGLGCV